MTSLKIYFGQLKKKALWPFKFFGQLKKIERKKAVDQQVAFYHPMPYQTRTRGDYRGRPRPNSGGIRRRNNFSMPVQGNRNVRGRRGGRGGTRGRGFIRNASRGRGRGFRGGRRRGGKKNTKSEEELDAQFENYWKQGGDEKQLERVQKLNEEAKQQRKQEEEKKADEAFNKYRTAGASEEKTEDTSNRGQFNPITLMKIK
eukprot:maker-scaffold_46-snap-gene-1.100-mRNA-1 protein AED:0.07 eAED:0.07 QI:42/0.66/0.75/1/1/1/4/139/200